MARSLMDLGCPKAKVKVHHLGVNVDAISFSPRSWRPGTPLRVLLAGSFTEKKGLPYAIKALGRLVHAVELEVLVVGDADSKPAHQLEKFRILTAVQDSGLGSRVRMLGFQSHSQLLETARTCHIFMSPSVTAVDGDSEGGAPVTIIEMAASGMPVVTTRHCDIPEVLEGGASGLLADERDIDGLVDRLRQLLDNPDSWQSLTTAARRRIEVEFDAVTQGRRLAAYYDDVVFEL